MSGNLTDLTYGIDFDINDNGLNRAIQAENQINIALRNAATSANTVDSNISRVARSSQTATTSTRGINNELINSSNGARTLANDVDNVNNNSERVNSTFNKISKVIAGLGVGLSLGAVAKAATNSFTGFEDTMANVHATIGKISDKDLKDLTNTALEFGSKSVYSSKQVAEGMWYLSSAGYDAKTQIQIIPDLLNLASAGGLDLSKSSDILTTSMSTLGLSTKDIPVFIDQMAVAAQASQTDIDQLGAAITNVGGSAKNANLSTADLNTELAILANNGLRGAEGGTALRNTLLNLTAPNEQVANLMKELGIKVLDTHGKIKPLNDILLTLKDKLKGFNEGERMGILEKIGGKENIQALNTLLAGSGKSFDDYKSKITNSKGAAKEMADIQNDTLSGSFKLLKNSIDATFLKDINSTTTGTSLREFINEVTASVPKAENEIVYFLGIMKDIFSFIQGNWGTLKPIILSVVEAIAAYKLTVIAINTVQEINNALLLISALRTGGLNLATMAMESTTGSATIAQWALNAALNANPIGLVIATIAALGVAIYLVITHWKDICTWVKNAWSAIINNPIADFILSVNPFTAILYNIAKHFDDITGAISKAWDWLTSWNGTKAKDKDINVNTKYNYDGGVGNQAYGPVQKINGSHANGLDYVPFDGYIGELHKGERVMTAKENSQNIMNQSNTYTTPVKSRGNVSIQSQMPAIIITINASKDPKATAIEVSNKLEKTVKKILDESFATLTLQMGYGSTN